MVFCLGGTQVDSPKDSSTECLTLSRQEGNLDAGPGAGSPPGPWALMAAAQWAVSYHLLSTLEATVGTDSRIPSSEDRPFCLTRSLTRSLLCPTHQMCKPCHLCRRACTPWPFCTAPETPDVPGASVPSLRQPGPAGASAPLCWPLC